MLLAPMVAEYFEIGDAWRNFHISLLVALNLMAIAIITLVRDRSLFTKSLSYAIFTICLCGTAYYILIEFGYATDIIPLKQWIHYVN